MFKKYKPVHEEYQYTRSANYYHWHRAIVAHWREDHKRRRGGCATSSESLGEELRELPVTAACWLDGRNLLRNVSELNSKKVCDSSEMALARTDVMN